VAADPGMMGGKISHEYMYLNPAGEDTVISCRVCGYRANRQTARMHKQLYPEDPGHIEMVETPETTTIAALTEFLDIPARKTAKVVFSVGSFAYHDDPGRSYEKLVTAVIRGDLEVEEAKLQRACEARHLRPATEEEIRASGMSPGYGSPIGAWNSFVVVDDSAAGSNNLVAGANRAGYHFRNSNFARDYLGTVADIAAARAGDPCPECGKPLGADRGIEVGNIFQLGTRYSEPMGATFQDESGRQQPLSMGSYGIGIGRLLGALAEEYHDAAGLALPPSVAPFQVHLLDLLGDGGKEAEALCGELEAAGLEVLLDDRKESAGVKFNDADLLGMPLRITLGKKAHKEGQVEFSRRADGESWRVPRERAAEAVRDMLRRSGQSG
jgi:prolyl-tRNA synthetase